MSDESPQVPGHWEVTGKDVKLDALGSLVLKLNLSGEEVGGGDGIGDDQAVGEVGVLDFALSKDVAGLDILVTSDGKVLKELGESFLTKLTTPLEVKVLTSSLA